MVKTVINQRGLFLYNSTNAETVNLTYTGEATFSGNVTTTQTFVGSGGTGGGYEDPANISINTLNVNSTTTLYNANVSTNLTLGGNLTVSQTSYLSNTEITGTLDVSGNTSLARITTTNNATVGGNLTVSQTSYLADTSISGVISTTENASVGGNLTVSQGAYFGDAEMTGDLDVAGATTVVNLTSTDNVSVGGNLTVS